MPTVTSPLARATSSALNTLGERPEVEMPTNTSPATPTASTWRANTRS